MHVDAPDEVHAAVALIDATCTIQRATAPFLELFAEHLASQSGEVERVVTGEVDHATALLDGVEADIAAVLADDHRRQALVTVPLDPHDQAPGAPNPLLELPLDSSPAIVWLKGLDGRYLRVNRAYSTHLRIDAEEVCGRTDAEIAPESIDGTRLRQLGSVEHDPLELEYTVAAVDDRPAFSVLRFALRDAGGRPIAVCGVAAPSAQAQVARAECTRLMRIERLGGLDQSSIREGLLAEWGLTPAPGPAPAALPPTPDEPPAPAHSPPPEREDGEAEEARARAERAEAEAKAALARAQEELQQSTADAESAAAILVDERQKVERLRSELAAVRDQLESAQRSLAERPSREELEEERARAERADAALGEERARVARAEATAQSALAQAQEQPAAVPARRGGIFGRLLRGAR